MIPRAVSADVEEVAAALPTSRYPPAAGELRLYFPLGPASDRVGVLLDSPGPPAAWGGPDSAPLRVLIVPMGPVPAPGQPDPSLDWESWSARELVVWMEKVRHLARAERHARYAVLAPACYRAAFDPEWPGCAAALGSEPEERARDGNGKPDGWCWWCWNTHRIEELEACIEALRGDEP